MLVIFAITRKSSCVNARGTPPAAWQVLAMLLCVMGGVPRVGGYPISGKGGTPSQVWGVYPISGLGGVPHLRSGGYPISGPGGYPISGLGGYLGYPPTQTWDGVPPYLDMGWGAPLPRPEMRYPSHLDVRWGTPYLDLGLGTPPHPDLGWSTPPYPDLRWGTPAPPPPASVDRLKILPSLILRMRAVKILWNTQ